MGGAAGNPLLRPAAGVRRRIHVSRPRVAPVRGHPRPRPPGRADPARAPGRRGCRLPAPAPAPPPRAAGGILLAFRGRPGQRRGPAAHGPAHQPLHRRPPSRGDRGRQPARGRQDAPDPGHRPGARRRRTDPDPARRRRGAGEAIVRRGTGSNQEHPPAGQRAQPGSSRPSSSRTSSPRSSPSASWGNPW